MNMLQKHVNRLFAPYPDTPEIREMKDEIAGNLEAKVADLMKEGMDYNEAVRLAVADIPSVDGLIEEDREIFVNRYRLELGQLALLFSLILWIVTIPMRLIERSALSYLTFALVLGTGIVYLTLNTLWKKESLDRTARRSLRMARRHAGLAWIIWGLFIFVSVLAVTALQFGNNLWFARPVTLSGPYQFAVVGLSYAKPFLTLPIPLLFQASVRLIRKHDITCGPHR
ncbi:hypothetical protein HMSSN036_92740 [Paenibacillus macerans]|nr:hypothetical protein HMSSN036_92740 [Paenibacillus macerans]